MGVFVVTIIILFVYKFFNGNDENNGFKRTIKRQKIDFVKQFPLPLTPFYFAGVTPEELYLKDSKNTTSLFSINYSLDGLRRNKLKLPKESGKQVTIGLLDTTIYVVTNNSGKLNVLSKNTFIVHNFKSPEIMFNHARLISKQSIVGVSAKTQGQQVQRVLSKLNYIKSKVEKEHILEKQVDGFFCTDGMLQFDPKSSKLFYMYFYRGDFFCLDTNMNTLYKAKTIDTVNKVEMKIAKISKTSDHEKQTSIIPAEPAKLINRKFIIFQNCIYILSALKADNESSSDFKNNQVVDVYSIDKGGYLYSFYIPKYKGFKLREFRLTENFIFATFNNYLVKYTWTRY